MTATEIQKRSERAQQLRVLQTQGNEFYVESAEGKILYRVFMDENQVSCTCGDFARNAKVDPNFRCKHIMAVDAVFENGDFQDAQFIQKRKPKLDERFIMRLEGKDFVLYAGLLDLAHQKGVLRIEVEPLQLPDKENGNFAICRATVVSKSGETFIDVGDANPGNCNSRVAKHLLRMASTRSIARALRSFTNIGMTCLEELSDISDAIGDKGNGAKGKRTPVKKPVPDKSNAGQENPDERKPQQAQPEKRNTQKAQTGKGNAQSRKETRQPRKIEPAENKASQADQGSQGENDESRKTAKESPATQNASQSTQEESSKAPGMSEAQTRAVYNLSRRRGISVEDLEAMALERYNTPLENLTSKDASEFIRHLQQAA